MKVLSKQNLQSLILAINQSLVLIVSQAPNLPAAVSPVALTAPVASSAPVTLTAPVASSAPVALTTPAQINSNGCECCPKPLVIELSKSDPDPVLSTGIEIERINAPTIPPTAIEIEQIKPPTTDPKVINIEKEGCLCSPNSKGTVIEL